MDRQSRRSPTPGCGHRPRPRTRPPANVIVLILILSLVTALALLGLAATLADPVPAAPAGDPSAAAHVALVRAFYAAINDAARTGDTAPLAWLVAPDFAWCEACPGQAPTRDGLRRYLINLHQTAPEARLTVDAIVAADATTVTAQVHATAFPLAALPPWGPVDTFRLTNGMLAARSQGLDDVTLASSLLTADVAALPPAVTGLALARLTLLPGSRAQGLVSPGPTLLVVEAGTLQTWIARGGRIVRHGMAAPPLVESGPALQAALGSGDAAIVPAGVRYDLVDPAATPTIVLGATFSFVDDGALTTPRRPDAALFVPPGSLGGAMALPTVHALAAGAVSVWPPGPIRLGLARLVLGPRAMLVPPPAETALLAVEAGALTLDGGPPRPVGASEGVLRPASAAGAIHNAGDGPLVLLVVTVAPADSAEQRADGTTLMAAQGDALAAGEPTVSCHDGLCLR